MSSTRCFLVVMGLLGAAWPLAAHHSASMFDDTKLVELASAVLRRNAQTPVLVKADEAVPYGRVVIGAALLQQSGATKIGFQTDPAGTDRERGGR